MARVEKRLAALEWDYSTAMVTVTLPDRRVSGLEEAWDTLNEGLAKLERSPAWRSADVRGRLTGIEIVRGKGAGLWHLHAHILVVLPGRWSAAQLDAWRFRVVATWLQLVPGTSPKAQDVQLVGAGGLAEVVKYSVKTSSLVCGRPVEEAAADVVEVLFFLRHHRCLRTAGCLYGIVAGVEEEEELPDEVSDAPPPCLVCGEPEGIARVEDGCSVEGDGYRDVGTVARDQCLPIPGWRGWYVRVLGAGLGAGGEPAWVIPRDALVALVAQLGAVHQGRVAESPRA